MQKMLFTSQLGNMDYAFLGYLGLVVVAALIMPVVATFKTISIYNSDKYLVKVLGRDSLGATFKRALSKEIPRIIAVLVLTSVGIGIILLISKLFNIEHYQLFRLIILSKSQLIKAIFIVVGYSLATFIYTEFYRGIVKMALSDKKITIGCNSYKYKKVEEYFWNDNMLIIKIKKGGDGRTISNNVSSMDVFEIEIPMDKKDILERRLKTLLQMNYQGGY